MLEFLPWSKKLLRECLFRYKTQNVLSVLDVELGGACNFKCKYCDTPNYTQCIQFGLEEIEQLALDGKISWLYLCGLGEPTAGKNKQDFKILLRFCKKHGIKCSVFTNIAEFDDELFFYVEEQVLYPMFKYDSLKCETLCEIYNISRQLADKHLKNIERLSKLVVVKDGYTNICASIVPTNDNIEDLKDNILWCYEHNIFPLIGELEDAGKGQTEYYALKPSNAKLNELKEYINKVAGEQYDIPICPSTLFGLHVDHDGLIAVDAISGLSCHWFWLSEPKIDRLCMIKGHTFKELSDLVIGNRKGKISELHNILSQIKPLVFGGCGGDVVSLLNYYLTNLV